MRIFETVTHRGEGTWYKRYDVQLVTTRTHQRFYYEQREEVTTRYVLRFAEHETGNRPDSRAFASAEQRAVFISAAFSDLDLHALNAPTEVLVPHLLDSVFGSTLISVAFILDHLNLTFEDESDSHSFDIFEMPTLFTPAGVLRETDLGFTDALRTLISREVTSVEEYVDAGLVWEFGETERIELPIRPSEKVEVALYSNTSNLMQVWRPGDDL